MGNNEEPRLEPLGLSVCVYMCVHTHVCPSISLSHSERPIGGTKQSPTENSTDYTNDDYGDNDRPAISLVIIVCCI